MREKGCVLITGAARRIGRALALDLGRLGWQVAVHYRTSEAAAYTRRAAVLNPGVNGGLVR